MKLLLLPDCRFLTMVVLFLHLAWPMSARAIHENKAVVKRGDKTEELKAVPLPDPPAVLVFHGGFLKFKDIDWGGRKGFDATCEGIIRQRLGLLDDRGKPIKVPEGQRITAVVNGERRVVGFTDKTFQYRAFNIDVSSFGAAFSQLGRLENDKLYSCGHGFKDDRGSKGGIIVLDSGNSFNGFRAPGFQRDGTNARKPPVRPYPPFDPSLARPPRPVEAHLHHCFSGADPDGEGKEKHAVSVTLEAIGNVNVVHSHLRTALNGPVSGVEDGGLAVRRPTPQELKRAKIAIQTWKRVQKRVPFGDLYQLGQDLIDFAVSPAPRGTAKFHLSYLDLGEGPDPPDILSGCVEPHSFGNSQAELEITGPFGSELVALFGLTEVEIDHATLGDSDGDGFDEVQTEIAKLELSGESVNLGPLAVRLRGPIKSPFQRLTGQVVESSQIEPDRLDIEPSCDAAAEPACLGTTATSFFDLFLEIELPGSVLLHNLDPKRIQAIITNERPAKGETYENFDVTPLFDESGNPNGLELGTLFFTPETPFAVTKFVGHAKQVGVPENGAEVKIQGGRFAFAGPLDLSAAAVTFSELLNETGVAGELVSGVPFALEARRGSKPNSAIFESPSGERPDRRLEIKSRSEGIFEFSYKEKRGNIPRNSGQCEAGEPTTKLFTSFTIDDGVNPPVVVSTGEDWRCSRTQLRVSRETKASATPSKPKPPSDKNERPRVNFKANPRRGDAPLTVQFTNTSRDSDGEIAALLWDFGDGTTSTEENPLHTYATPGKFDVRLSVTDNEGATSTKSARGKIKVK